MEEQVIADRYHVRRRIGAGGAAQVYLATDRVLGRDVALKVLHPESAADPLFVERFRREARSAASLSHPNVVLIYDWGSVGNTYYMVMEYVAGMDLKAVLQSGPLPEDRALAVAQQVAAALEAAHQRGIIHRDVKPHNILLASDGPVKVTDFGIARAVGLSQLTKTDVVTGTAHYISPEQVQRKEIDGRSDLYSLGVVLYEMLSGREPFRGDSLVEVALQHVHDAPVPPRKIRPALAKETEIVVLKAMAKEPRRRYQTASEFGYAVEYARSQLIDKPSQSRESPVSVDANNSEATAELLPARKQEIRDGVSAGRNDPARTDRRRGLAWIMALPALLLVVIVAGSVLVLGHGASKSAVHASPTPASRPARSRPSARVPASTSQPTATGAATRAPAAVPHVTASPAAPAPSTSSVPPNPPAPTVVAAANAPPGGDPKDAVLTFYNLVSAGELPQAAQLWTEHMKSIWDPQAAIDQRFAATQSMTVENVQILNQTDHDAMVSATVYDQEKPGSERSSATYDLTWFLVRRGSHWLLDNVAS